MACEVLLTLTSNWVRKRFEEGARGIVTNGGAKPGDLRLSGDGKRRVTVSTQKELEPRTQPYIAPVFASGATKGASNEWS